MRNRTYVIGIGISIVLLALYVGMHVITETPSDYESVDYLIGISHPNLTDEWQLVVHDELEDYAKTVDHLSVIFRNAGASSYKQMNDIDRLMEYGIDLLIITVTDANVLGPVLNDIQKKIPVIILDKDISYYDYTLFIGPDYVKVGEVGARRIEDLAEGKPFNIVTVNGAIEDTMTTDIHDGFATTINHSSYMHIVENLYTSGLRTDARKEFGQLLKGNMEVDAVFAQNNAIAMGVEEALKEAGQSIPIITVSKFLSDKYLTYLELNAINTIIYTPVGGREAIDYALEILSNKEDLDKVPKRMIMRSFEVTKENKDNYSVEKYAYSPLKVAYLKSGEIEENLFGQMDIMSGVEVETTVTDARSDNETDQYQKDWVIEQARKGMDLIVIQPIRSKDWEKVLEVIKEKGSHLICLGNTIDVPSEYITYIGPDYMDQSSRLANYLINNVYSIHYDIGIMEIAESGNPWKSHEKSTLLRQQLLGYSRITIVDYIEGRGATSKSREQLQQVIAASLDKYRQDVNVVYLHNTELLEPLKKALKETGMEDVVLLSHNENGQPTTDKQVDYQVYPIITYRQQLAMVIRNYQKKRQLSIESIYLQNRSTQR